MTPKKKALSRLPVDLGVRSDGMDPWTLGFSEAVMGRGDAVPGCRINGQVFRGDRCPC